jgi:uncharacterized repeat protein (TIGR03803 family)
MKIILKPMALTLTALLLTAASAPAASLSVLHTFGVFSNLTGVNPQAPLVQGPDGTFYGTASTLASAVGGVVFKMQPDASQFTVLHVLTSSEGDIALGGLLLAGNTLYGTAQQGGISNNGTVFKVNTDGTGFAVLYRFSARLRDPIYGTYYTDGTYPVGTLVLSGNTLYGATTFGGTNNGEGTVFAINTDGSGFTNLHHFGYDEPQPHGGLTLSGGTLYGTALVNVFKINTDGTGFTNIFSFNGSDGGVPYANLLLSGGTLYGTTENGGLGNMGTVFAINTDGTGFTNLHNFSNNFDSLSAQNPAAGLLLAGGKLYGTTAGLQWADDLGFESGSVFRINTDGTGFTNLHSFSASGFGVFGVTNSDGASPVAALVLSGNTLFGTAEFSGSRGFGTVFKVNTDCTSYTVLRTFTPSSVANDGAQPKGSLVLTGNTLYGTTSAGGDGAVGTVFQVNTDGTGFTNVCSQGSQGGVVLSGNTLYGTGGGGLFGVETDGTGLTNLNFGPGNSLGGLILSGSTLYGTEPGGAGYDFNGKIRASGGGVFSVNTDGSGFTNIYLFPLSGSNGVFIGTNGGFSGAGLLLSGSTLYGTTAGFFGSGAFGTSVGFASTVFKVNIDGSGFTTLHSFSGGNDGASPNADLVMSGGILYGTASGGGTSGLGTVFALKTDGTGFKTLHTFQGNDGASPAAGLLLSGGTLYGTTEYGGNAGDGTVFAINTNGTGFVSIYSFTKEIDGANPAADLVLSGKTLYGTVQYGGALANGGLVFALNLLPSPIPLNLHSTSNAVILSWSDPAFSLTAAPTVTGVYTNVPGATSPYTNAITGSQKFFRLKQ